MYVGMNFCDPVAKEDVVMLGLDVCRRRRFGKACERVERAWQLLWEM